MDTRPADLTIGFPRESGTERRTILTPALARALIEAGFGVVTEPGIGAGVFTGDEEYAAAGVRLTESGRVWSAPLLLRYKSPGPADLQHLRPGQHIAALFHAEGDVGLLTALQDCGATAWSYEFITEHGRFPLGRPGGHHGRYSEFVHIDGGGWYDANTPVRSIQKGYLLAAERELYDACSVSVDGADWGGSWHASVLAPALAQLGIPPEDWPVSIFTPLITDRTGGKLSKTLYVAHGTYADLPELFLNLGVLLVQHGEQILELVWGEVTRWAREPRRLHRTYTVDYITALLDAGLPAAQLRTA